MRDDFFLFFLNSLVVTLNAGFILADSPFAIIHYFLGVIFPAISFYNLGKQEGKNEQ